VYNRGAMTLHALRTTVGDEKFFTILKTWAAEKAGGTGTSKQFIEVAERISGQELDRLFDAWLYQPVRPAKP
jgi:aminopeptidase N